LPFLQWKIAKEKGNQAGLLIAKWFNPVACAHASDAYWDPHDKCVKNTSNKMLEMATNDTDNLYWEVESHNHQNGRGPKLRKSHLMILFQLSTQQPCGRKRQQSKP